MPPHLHTSDGQFLTLAWQFKVHHASVVGFL